ncbi:MAG TPA: peptidoglycan editing factor PgeF [Candidatus Eisenbacteria bacterium]|nr:peptidoglycan editing factor PgeF [Candidatus Eisenbacteria bacterium]
MATKQSRKKRSSPANDVEILRADVFAGIPWVVHGFSTRTGGVSTSYGGMSLNLGVTSHDTHANVERNRALFLQAVGAIQADGSLWPLVQVRQTHSAITHHITEVHAHALAGDGMITNTPGLLLAIKTADCVPVLIADVKLRVVGAFHAGWRGTAARVVEKGVGEMRRQFGSAPPDLRAAIGPSIRKCCYSVGAEVRAEFESQFSYADELFEEVFDSNAIHVKYPLLFLNQRAPGHGGLGPEIHLDLVAANQRQLEDAGVSSEHVSVIDGCTACDTERFFSHRAEFGKTGRMMAVIGIRAG